MKAIVAVDRNWAIGRDNALLERIGEDMQFFRRMTTGKTVIMGRKTFESLPGSAPLKDRANIVLSRSGSFVNSDKVQVYASVDELLAGAYNNDETFVIGGAEVYRLLLPYCDKAYVTMIDNVYAADKFFVNLAEDCEWTKTVTGEELLHDGISYRHCEFDRIK